MKPLPLSGVAYRSTTLPAEDDGITWRLRRPGDGLGHSFSDADALLLTTADDLHQIDQKFVAIGDLEIGQSSSLESIYLKEEFSYLQAGDVIGFQPGNKRVRVLYRRNSSHNFFLTTERCNHYCLMCSQPPKDSDDSWLLRRLAKTIPLIDPLTKSIGFTGGEPLLNPEPLFAILADARRYLPDTAIHVLSNGKAFADVAVTKGWADIGHPNLTVGIPLYSSVDYIHDYVVQSKGAFDETVLGILRLKDLGQRVEIRVVLHKVTTKGLAQTAQWLARNLPFVDHVALMGMENTGFALANESEILIDPLEYKEELAQAVQILDAARLKVSIYNLPYCVLDRSVWPFAVQSISDWKNGYISACSECEAKPSCAGFFSSGRPKLSRGVQAIRDFASTRYVEQLVA